MGVFNTKASFFFVQGRTLITYWEELFQLVSSSPKEPNDILLHSSPIQLGKSISTNAHYVTQQKYFFTSKF
jgi:hypothetical protein